MIILYLKRAKRLISQTIIGIQDFYRRASYFSDSPFKNNHYYKCEREILVYSHTIEKGLSHKVLKPLFGYSLAKQLYRNVIEYSNYNQSNEFFLKLGVSAISKYNKVNLELGVDPTKLFRIPDSLNDYDVLDIGSYLVTAPDYFKSIASDFKEFSESRKSVRLYDSRSDEIKLEELKDVIEMSRVSPSACNRQAVRVYIVQDRDKIEKISNIQGGSSGFGTNAGAFLLIYSDLHYYTSEERRVPMFDAGLFAMNLLYSLHYKRLGACILNGSVSSQQENQIRNIINNGKNEELAALIAVSKISNEQSILIADSLRKNTNMISKSL